MTFGSLLSSKQIENNRYYVRSIAEIVQFLAVNELALRGNYSLDQEKETGLFINLFEFTLKKDLKLREISSIILQNARYTSPQIQNEIIELLSNMVITNVCSEINKAVAYSLLADTTRDKHNNEDLAICTRYTDLNGFINERCFALV